MRQRNNIYKGFSSDNYEKNGTFVLTDLELVKADILRHIFTKKGDRVMMPTFGTIIPDILFEPLTSDLVDLVRSDIETVLRYDPRVQLIRLSVEPLYDQSAIVIFADLFYIELNLQDRLDIRIDFEN
jgi:phage baseplate assembly protein W